MTAYLDYHLALSKAGFTARQGFYAALKDESVTLQEVPPTYPNFLFVFEKVGEPWGWTRRPKYVTDKNNLLQRLAAPGTRLFYIRHDGQAVGYCLAVEYPDSLKHAFNTALEPPTAEIENFGFFPGETGKGYGKAALPLLFEELFRRHNSVYLSSRSTNHARVIPFYESLGMSVLRIDQRPDDLLPG